MSVVVAEDTVTTLVTDDEHRVSTGARPTLVLGEAGTVTKSAVTSEPLRKVVTETEVIKSPAA